MKPILVILIVLLLIGIICDVCSLTDMEEELDVFVIGMYYLGDFFGAILGYTHKQVIRWLGIALVFGFYIITKLSNMPTTNLEWIKFTKGAVAFLIAELVLAYFLHLLSNMLKKKKIVRKKK